MTEETKNSNSGFIFGLILGAIIGAIVAIIIYKNNKTEVFENLSQKLQDFFKGFTNEESKPSRSVSTSPKKIIATVTPKPKKPAPKMFVKPKR